MPIIEMPYMPPMTVFRVTPPPLPAELIIIIAMAPAPATIGSIRSTAPKFFAPCGAGISGGDSSRRSPLGMGGGSARFARW